MKTYFVLAHQTARANACAAIMSAPAGYAVALNPYKRSLEQNNLFHKLCDLAAKNATYINRKLTTLQWKNLFVSGHTVVTQGETDFVPGLEGEFVNLRESTASMSIKRANSLIEYTQAYLANQGIFLNPVREAA